MNSHRTSVLVLIAACVVSAVCSPSPDENTSKIFFFHPPAQFQDREQYFDSHHHVATLSPDGIVDRDGMIRFDQPYLNFSQSAWDPKTRSLFTWKKNFEGRDHLMQVRLPDLEVEPVARFPESGGSPLLAMDTERRRILVASRYGYNLAGLRGGQLVREFQLYDLDEESWISGSFGDVGLVTISYSGALDRFIALGRRVGSASGDRNARDDRAMIFHFDPEGRLIDSVPTDLVDHLHSPIAQHGPPDSLGVNHPGIQSRIIGNDLVILRYVDLGRESAKDRYDWSYELYVVDPISGSSRFVNAFR